MSHPQSVQQVVSRGRLQNAQGRSYRLEITVPYGIRMPRASARCGARERTDRWPSSQGPAPHTIFFAQFWGQEIHGRRDQLSRSACFS